MTKLEFLSACAERFIEPNIALENESVIEALKSRDVEAVIKALDEEF